MKDVILKIKPKINLRIKSTKRNSTTLDDNWRCDDASAGLEMGRTSKAHTRGIAGRRIRVVTRKVNKRRSRERTQQSVMKAKGV